MTKNAKSADAASPVLTMEGLCTYLQISRASAYRLLKQGELKRVRVAGRTLIRRSDADELIARSVVA